MGPDAVSCSFTVAYTDRQSADSIVDVVTVDGTDPFGQPVSDFDDATVTVTNRDPVIRVDKQNPQGQTTIVAPGGLATWTIAVFNDGDPVLGEPLTLTAVTDQLQVDGTDFGAPLDITTVGGPVTATTCGNIADESVTILPGAAPYTCQITVDTEQLGSLVVGQDQVLTNIVTVTGRDDDPAPTFVEGFDPADKNVVATAPVLEVFKTDFEATVAEPGMDIEYTIDITNSGQVGSANAIRIDRITDTVFFTPKAGGEALVGVVTIEDNPAGAPIEITPAIGGVVGQVSPSAGAAPRDVTLVGTTCDALIGTVLDPQTDTSCTITLNLPANDGDLYRDEVVVNGTEIDDAGAPGDPVDASNGATTPASNVDPAVEIIKTAAPTSVPETGDNVTFSFLITNTSVSTDPITLTALGDSVYGDLFDATNPAVTNSSCALLDGNVLQPGASTSCSFDVFVSGTVASPHVNVVTVTAVDDDDGSQEATDDDDATVTFTDTVPAISVLKTANPTSVPESGGEVIYTLLVENQTAEPVNLNSLVDDPFGDVTQLAVTTCDLDPAPVLAGSDGVPGEGPDTYSCTFTVDLVQENGDPTHVNTVTASATDDEGNPATATDDETVTFDLIPPTVDITKTDITADLGISEPGGLATYELTIVNTSFEAVTITSLTDTINYNNPVETIGPFSILDQADNPTPTKADPLESSECVTTLPCAI